MANQSWLAAWLVVCACGGSDPAQPDAPSPDATSGPTWARDPSFATDGALAIAIPDADRLNAVSILVRDGTLVLAAGIEHSGRQELELCSISPDGVRDPGFGSDGCVRPGLYGIGGDNVAVDGTGLLIASIAFSGQPVFGPAVYRLRADGQFDTAFGFGGAVFVQPPSGTGSDAVLGAIATLPDGSRVVGGYASIVGAPRGTGWAQRLVDGMPSGAPVEIGRELPLLVPSATGIDAIATEQAQVNECPPVACDATQVSRYAACIAPPVACAADLTCPGSDTCDPQTLDCLPPDVWAFGTRVIALETSLAIQDDRRIAPVTATQALRLADGSMLVAQQDAEHGVWKLNADHTRDLAFGIVGGVTLRNATVSALAARSDGTLFAAGHLAFDGPSQLFELASTGAITLAVADPGGGRITGLVPTPDGRLLVAGYLGNSIVVQRLIRVP
ncbi:MAG TPA: hypothetical protein VFQ53_42105 [Kofleriaceae bacterium]|nr:hypothetical protein [Kofleriaceae bacterium]